QHGAVLLEGPRLIRDALEAGAAPRTLFFSALEQLEALPQARLKGANLVKVKFEDIKSWSDLVAPQGLLGIFSKPDYDKMAYPAAQLSSSLPMVLICDNIRDPGNLGTILRSAAGAGCEKVLLTKGCVDAWEPKVLRAGMGAHFRVPIIANLDWESVPEKLPVGTRVCVADNRDGSARTEPELAAGSAGSNTAAPSAPKPQPRARPSAGEDRQGLELAARRYHESWARAPVAVVVGGETQGVSAGALRLAASSGGSRLVIPVAPGVDSLNSAIAAGILLFEGKRQLGQGHRQGEGQQVPAVG
ncbi:MRM3 methyltransferase, partial [Eudromia elegans]|nr:MRM3 methyltransferase [Eudromia elegans]